MTAVIRFTDFGVVVDNPLTIDDLEGLLVQLPNIIAKAKENELNKAKLALAKAEEKVNTIRLYLESLQ